MPALDSAAVLRDLIAAMRGELTQHWQLARPYAESEAKKMAETAKLIVRGSASGDINPQQARILVRMQANASQAVLTAIETIGMIAAQDAINAALGVLKKAVNTAAGITLL
ncbi:MAG TPA: hypothetical protein VGO90_14330 [Chthoniobacteraceae bacterium]|jgi:hypothetical protein|nr:hypothetical protein [Chthoniobacteraceae bacterium]